MHLISATEPARLCRKQRARAGTQTDPQLQVAPGAVWTRKKRLGGGPGASGTPTKNKNFQTPSSPVSYTDATGLSVAPSG